VAAVGLLAVTGWNRFIDATGLCVVVLQVGQLLLVALFPCMQHCSAVLCCADRVLGSGGDSAPSISWSGILLVHACVLAWGSARAGCKLGA
jgi:hypothetical protein